VFDGSKSVQAGIESEEYDLVHGRTKIRGMLSEIGVKATQLEYDDESAMFNVEVKASMGEFPILYPYPRTGTGAYAVRKGWFDGNYDALHHSYQNRSPFSCFTDKEKGVQQNLALLSPVAMLFSGSRNHKTMKMLTSPVSWLLFKVAARITLPLATKIYQQLYSVSKTYIYHERIYPMERSWRERIHDFAEAFHLDVFKQFKKQTISDEQKDGPVIRGDRPGQTLGGPPSV
jgi:hypothetical protein